MKSPWAWYPYMNKGLAAYMAEELVETDQVLWLDSDVLVVSEPTQLILGEHEDFACCSVDKNVGTSGPNDPNEPYWTALSDYFGVSIDRLPWVRTEFDKLLVRMRLHSGVYSFRRATGLGRAFARDIESMLGSRIAFSQSLPYPGDDVALAFSVVRRNLRWRPLPMSYNFEMTPTSRIYSREEAQNARILHFHSTLGSPSGATWFLNELEHFRPDVAEWLRPRVPLRTKTGGLRKAFLRRYLGHKRKLAQARHQHSCRVMVSV